MIPHPPPQSIRSRFTPAELASHYSGSDVPGGLMPADIVCDENKIDHTMGGDNPVERVRPRGAGGGGREGRVRSWAGKWVAVRGSMEEGRESGVFAGRARVGFLHGALMCRLLVCCGCCCCPAAAHHNRQVGFFKEGGSGKYHTARHQVVGIMPHFFQVRGRGAGRERAVAGVVDTSPY